jgi:hypothetical protein
MNSITLLGISIIFLYSSTKIMEFYGLDTSNYGPYILFFVFMLINILVLPNEEPKL